MGYLGRRIGLSQDSGDSNPGGAGGAVGGGILDLFANGYLERQGKIYNAPGMPPLSGMTATGGIINDYTDGPAIYRTHIFTSSGVFNITDDTSSFGQTVDYLIIAGGGGGGGGYEAGGGGAGGYRTTCPEGPGGGGSSEGAYTVATGQYTITVGSGGAGGFTNSSGDGSPVRRGSSGSQSAFYPTPVSYPHPTYVRSEGGGGGGTYSPSNPVAEAIGKNGGSGGGAGNCHPAGPAAGGTANRIADTTTAVPTQGYKGGDRGPQAHSSYYNGAGGGGAGAAGADQNDNTLPGSFGGNGKRTTITGPGYTIGTPGPASAGGTGGGDSTAVTGGWLAGGGGGGLYGYPNMAHLPQTRGAGGGGAGGHGGNPVVDATSAVQATGSGGGGSGHTSNIGGSGGSGIVVVRYQIGEIAADARATGGSISFYNSGSGMKTIHTFTNSGTFATKDTWSPTNVEYVVIGGGGAGNGGPGPSCGGGGGAGGFITNTNHPIGTHPVSVNVIVGGGAASSPNKQVGGSPSQFGAPLTAYGGGGGGRHINGGGNPAEDGMPGGSGGGECDSQGPIGSGVGNKITGTTNNAPITPQGNPGGQGAGNGGANSVSGGGGGGAGQAGQDALDQDRGGHGGYGKQLPATFQNPESATSLGTSPNPNKYNGPNSGNFWFAGGGGGAASAPPHGLNALAGLGGGGQGYQNPSGSLPGPRDVMDAIQNTGGGGGAFHGPASDLPGAGKGGSGIVLIAYPT